MLYSKIIVQGTIDLPLIAQGEYSIYPLAVGDEVNITLVKRRIDGQTCELNDYVTFASMGIADQYFKIKLLAETACPNANVF